MNPQLQAAIAALMQGGGGMTPQPGVSPAAGALQPNAVQEWANPMGASNMAARTPRGNSVTPSPSPSGGLMALGGFTRG